MTDWLKRVLFGSFLGAGIGVLLGLALARILWPQPLPVAAPSPAVMDLEPTSTPALGAAAAGQLERDRALVVVSALYALDGDLSRARERLSVLNLEDPAAAMADLALAQAAAGNPQIATDLATLAAALGQGQGELVAYIATATPTLTPTPTPTSLPTFTPTPIPSPTPTASPTPLPPPAATRRPATKQPPPATAAPPAATPLPLQWDFRVNLLEPPVKLVEAGVAPGQKYWRLVRLEWRKPSEGGNTLLYITTLNEAGQPIWGQEVVVENGGHTVLYTDPKAGEPGANFPMFSTLNSYQVFVGGNLPSDRVTGLGLGERLGMTDHTSFTLVFQRTTR